MLIPVREVQWSPTNVFSNLENNSYIAYTFEKENNKD